MGVGPAFFYIAIVNSRLARLLFRPSADSVLYSLWRVIGRLHFVFFVACHRQTPFCILCGVSSAQPDKSAEQGFTLIVEKSRCVL